MLFVVAVFGLVALTIDSSECRLGPIKDEVSSKNDDRIMGGHEAKITDRPYQVSVHIKGPTQTNLCGGSILSSRYVLTAGHCFPEKVLNIKARAGSADKTKGGILYTAKNHTIHPKYIRHVHDYDMAIIDFGEGTIKTNGKTIKTIKLADEGLEVPDKTKVTISGWGHMDDGSKPAIMREVTIETIELSKCKKMDCTGHDMVKDRFICTSKDGGKKAYKGDSGGPLVLADSLVQVGVCSFGFDCKDKAGPSLYSSVPVMRSWIREVANV